MSAYPYLPLSTDAYLADTRHLTTVEHGAYLLLLMEAWRRPECSLPDDDAVLSRLAGMSELEWQTVKTRVMAFWKRDGRKKSWTQKRLLSEREYVAEKRKVKQDNAAKRWKQTKKTDAPAMRNACETDAPPPPPPQVVVAVDDARAKRSLAELLEDALGVYGCLMSTSPGMAILALPASWIAAGCDLDSDILPTVRAQTRQMAERNDPPGSWKVFERNVLKARDLRLSPAPAVQHRAAAPPMRGQSQHRNILAIADKVAADERAKNQISHSPVELLSAVSRRP